MASADRPLFDTSKGFDFQDPILPDDLVDQLYSEKSGIPEHHLHIEQADADLARRAIRPEPAHHVQTSATEPQITLFEATSLVPQSAV